MKIKKKVIIALSGAVAAVLVIGGIVFTVKKVSGKQVLVVPVSDVNEGFWGNNMDISGTITSNASQEIHLTDQQIVDEVFVQEGDTVKIGTPLLAFDMTLTNLNLESEKLNKEGLEIQKKGLENEINRLKKQTSVAHSSRSGSMIPAEMHTSKDVYSGIITVADAGSGSVIPDPTGTPGETPVPSPTGTPEETPTPSPTEVPEPTGTPEPTPTPVPVITADSCISENSKYIPMGMNENVRFYLAEYSEDHTARVSGTFLTQAKAQGISFYIGMCQDNVSNSELLASLFINGSQLGEYESGKTYLITLYSDEIISEEAPDEPLPDVEPVPEGYTQEELNAMIKEKQQELRSLNLDIRDCELRIAKIESSLNNQQINSTVNGIVKSVGDPEKGEINGEAFLVVESTEGLYVQGTLSELMLEEIQVGTRLMGTSWESGMSFEAEICEISSYPQDESYYDGYGNSNVSYYPFVAYIEGGEGFHNNEYIGFTDILDDEEMDDQGIYLDKMFIRDERGISYVYIADENNRLKKQEIITKSMGSSSYKIISGLTMEDRIAFPYGKYVKEGAAIKDGTIDELYNY